MFNLVVECVSINGSIFTYLSIKTHADGLIHDLVSLFPSCFFWLNLTMKFDSCLVYVYYV